MYDKVRVGVGLKVRVGFRQKRSENHDASSSRFTDKDPRHEASGPQKKQRADAVLQKSCGSVALQRVPSRTVT